MKILTVFLSSGLWEGDCERLFAWKDHLGFERILPPVGLKPMTP